MDLLKGTCPKCGEVLEIPAHLKQFSCLYCGARLSPADLKQEMAPTEANVDGAAAYQYYVDHVVNAVTGHRGIEEKLNKSDFDPAFQRYSAMNAETFRRLDEAVAAGAATVEEAADCFLDGLEEACGGWDYPPARTSAWPCRRRGAAATPRAPSTWATMTPS